MVLNISWGNAVAGGLNVQRCELELMEALCAMPGKALPDFRAVECQTALLFFWGQRLELCSVSISSRVEIEQIPSGGNRGAPPGMCTRVGRLKRWGVLHANFLKLWVFDLNGELFAAQIHPDGGAFKHVPGD